MDTNDTSIGCSPLQHIRFPGLSAIILLGLFAILRPAGATPPEWATPLKENVVASAKKIGSRVTDLRQIARGLRGLDREITMETACMAEKPLCQLDHIRELLLIESLVQNESDAVKRTMIEGMIINHLDLLGEYVDIVVEYINGSIAGLHNQAVVLAASKLRDDLRELKNLPKPPTP